MLVFALCSINKSQRQSLHNVELYVPRPIFIYGPLLRWFLELSIETNWRFLFLMTTRYPTYKTSSDVYKVVFCNFFLDKSFSVIFEHEQYLSCSWRILRCNARKEAFVISRVSNSLYYCIIIQMYISNIIHFIHLCIACVVNSFNEG